MTRRSWGRWPPRRCASPSPTPPAVSPTRFWRRRVCENRRSTPFFTDSRMESQMSDWSQRRLHFIGIGGAGMSGLALVCARLGAIVTGSDRSDSSYMERLREAGLDAVVGHDAANLPEGAEVVVSTAIGDDNPELSLARERGV